MEETRECISDNSDTDRLIMSFLPPDKLLKISCLNKRMFYTTCNETFWLYKYTELMNFNPVDKENLRRRYFKFSMNDKILAAVKVGDGQALQVYFNINKVKKARFLLD